jgi:two-component system, NarL family, response regulator
VSDLIEVKPILRRKVSSSADAGLIRILVAEDHLIARAGISTVVNAQPDMAVIAEATNGEQAIALFRRHHPDVVLMDVRMPVVNGFDAISTICKECQQAHIIALSTFGGDEDVRRALAAGARAYLTKDVLRAELITAILAVHAGDRYLPASIAAILAAEVPRPELTAREREVLRLIVRGLQNKHIAYELKISEETAKIHVKSILKKLGAGDRTEAATRAIQRGIIHLEE